MEQDLRVDKEFFNNKITDTIEIVSDPQVINDLFDLQAFVQAYIDFSILKKDSSAFDQYGAISGETKLVDLVKQQPNSDFFVKTMQKLLSREAKILGKRSNRQSP